MNYQQIFKQKEYMKLLIANAFTRFADSLDSLAFTWLVYSITNSATWSAIIFGLNQLPSILLQPLTGVIGDMFPRKKIIIVSHIARFSAICFVIYWIITNHITPLKLAIFTVFISIFEAVNMPASTSIVPQLLEEDMYTYGTSLSNTINRICELVGTGIAGIMIGIWKVYVVFIVDACCFLFAIVTESTIHPNKNDEINKTKQSYWTQLIDGLSYVKESVFFKNIVIMAMIVNAIFVPFNALQAPIVKEIFMADSTFLSVFNMAAVLGMIVGAMCMPKVIDRYTTSQIICTCVFLMGMSLVCISQGNLVSQFFIVKYIFIGIVMFTLGICASIVNGVISVKFMKIIPLNYLARCSSISSACSISVTPIVSFIISEIVKYSRVSTILMIFGMLCIGVVICLIQKMKFGD